MDIIFFAEGDVHKKNQTSGNSNLAKLLFDCIWIPRLPILLSWLVFLSIIFPETPSTFKEKLVHYF